jgi:hypothetical protein
MYKKKFFTGVLAAAMLIITGCKKDKDNATTVLISTMDISNISGGSPSDPVTASGGGDIEVVGAESISERGLVWSTSSKPTTADSKASAGTGKGNFTANLSGLGFGTTYYVRAYVINNGQTFYGNEKKFIASVPVELIVNGDFKLPDDGVKYASINSIPGWKTDEADPGFTGREYDYWRNSGSAYIYDWAKPIYQVVGEVPALASDYAIKFDANMSWDPWGDYKPTLHVIFSTYTGNDPATRVALDTVVVPETQVYGGWPGQDWGPPKTASFSIPAASAVAGQKLVIEFDVVPYDGGTFWSDVWYNFDNISVIQTLR